MSAGQCPECGGIWDMDEDPDACPHCQLTREDLEAAAEFLEDRVPQAVCAECGTLLTAVGVRAGERMGHCGVHGLVLAVDRFVV